MDLDVNPIRRLVMIGACYVDTILSVPSFPQQDHKLRATSLARRRGGNGANTLEVLQQFSALQTRDISLILLCALPHRDSPGSRFVQSSFGPRVHLDHCIYRPEHEEAASSYILKADDSGSRTIVNYNELPEMTFAEMQAQIRSICGREVGGRGRTWFHFEGREPETSTTCLRWIREEFPDSVLSVEIEKPGRLGLERMASEADVVFYSRLWAQAKGFDGAEKFLQEQVRDLEEASLLCCTWGEEGATVAGPKDGFVHEDRPQNAAGFNVVDPIGAGDTWTAGVLYMLLSWDGRGGLKERAKRAVEFANRLAGKKVSQEGFADLAEALQT